MKMGIILETKEYEKAWNAFRFAVTAKMEGSDSCPISTMLDCLALVEWADKTLTF